MNEQPERELLIDLTSAALMALEAGRKASAQLVALHRVLQDKGLITSEEIEAVERAHEVTRLLSESPSIGAFGEQWNALLQRLTEARRRLERE